MKRKHTIAVIIGVVCLAGISAAYIRGNMPRHETIVWEMTEEADADTIKKVANVLDGFQVPEDFEYYEKLQPSNPGAPEVHEVSVSRRGGEDGKLTVGFSQMEVNNDWRIYENISMLKAAEESGAELLYRNADGSLSKQRQDIEDLIQAGVDYLVIAPRQYTGYEEVIHRAKENGIPVILLDRYTNVLNADDYLTCIMGDFYDIGSRAAELLAEKLGSGSITVLEVTGTFSSSVAIELDEGFRSVAGEKGWTVIAVDGNFDKEGSLQPLEEAFIRYGPEIDAVFTHIDDSALTAMKVMRDSGIVYGNDTANGEVPIVSMGGYQDALKAITTGEMLATIECNPRLGAAVFYYIRRLENGFPIKNRIVIPGRTYDSGNAETYIYTEGY